MESMDIREIISKKVSFQPNAWSSIEKEISIEQVIKDIKSVLNESSEKYGLSFLNKMQDWEKARSDMLKIFEKQYFSHLLKQTKGHVTQAAKLAGIARESLQRIKKKHNLSSADFKN